MARGGGPLLSGGGPRDIPLLEGDHNRESEPPGGPGEQEAEWPASPGTRHGCAVRTRAARGRGPRWLKPLSGGLGRVRGLEREARPKEIAAGRAEEKAHVQVVEGVRGPGGVNPVLQLGVAGRAPSGCAASHADPAIRSGESRRWAACRSAEVDGVFPPEVFVGVTENIARRARIMRGGAVLHLEPCTRALFRRVGRSASLEHDPSPPWPTHTVERCASSLRPAGWRLGSRPALKSASRFRRSVHGSDSRDLGSATIRMVPSATSKAAMTYAPGGAARPAKRPHAPGYRLEAIGHLTESLQRRPARTSASGLSGGVHRVRRHSGICASC